MTLTQHFMLPRLNTRNDEYGGSLDNRVRLTREFLEDMREPVRDTCAVAFRFGVEEMLGSDGMQVAEGGRAVVMLMADLPDIWDVNVSDRGNESATNRFQTQDGYQNDNLSYVKQVTDKPVVGVGRPTSPNMMLSMQRKAIVDLIGAARPSIADPFIPRKTQEGCIEEIRECIGCNVCAASDGSGIPIRCTLNPTYGEEWWCRWHPESIAPRHNAAQMLAVGNGPTGLECAMQPARRENAVTLADWAIDFAGGFCAKANFRG